jgi:hypothetical protein
VHCFEDVFPRVKQKNRSNFAYGARQYVKTMNFAIRSAQKGRAYARHEDLKNEALPGLYAFEDMLEDRKKKTSGGNGKVRKSKGREWAWGRVIQP